MRLRHVLFLLLVLAAQLPAMSLGLWVRHYLETSSTDDVEDRHLMLARNVSSTLQRYHRDLVAAFELASDGPDSFVSVKSISAIYDNLGLLALCNVRLADGVLIQSAGGRSGDCSGMTTPAFFERLKPHVGPIDKTVITPVMDSPDGQKRLFALHAHADRLFIGEIATDFFVRLASSVRFGDAGHSVIVDQTGQVLAHPKREWVAKAQNLGKLDIIQSALGMKSGVTMFFSPAVKADMIAGFAGVPGAGWGVMVPQPLAELELQTYEALKPIYGVLSASLLAAMLIAHLFARRIARPLERVTAAARKAGQVAEMELVAEEAGRFAPREQREIVSAYNDMVRSIRASEAQMRQLAYSDGLTGLLNRPAFSTLAGRAIREPGFDGLLVYFDVDDFKGINDVYGHSAGDEALVEISRRVSGVLRQRYGDDSAVNPLAEPSRLRDTAEQPLFARFGGDEFVLLAPGLNARGEIDAFTQALVTAVNQPLLLSTGQITPGVSIGAATVCAPADGAPAETLDHALQKADAALYHAKARGKNRACLFAPEEGVRSIHDIRAEILGAIQSGQFALHYQPKVEARSGHVRSVEALVRWNHPQRGLVMPGAFIPAIEDSNEIIALGEWVVREAAAQALAWQRDGRALSVAVNIASRHYTTPGFARRMLEIAGESGIDPSRLILEITEEAAMHPDDDVGAVIAELKESGFEVALDDYGRGYSNLQRLAQISVDAIKIDRSLIAQVNSHARTHDIVAATVAMAEALNCRVVAEGIEDAMHAATLRKLGCHELQGFYFAKPMVAADLDAWLEARSGSEIAALQEKLVSGF